MLSSGASPDLAHNVTRLSADVRDIAAVRSAIHEFQPDHIYHLAAISSVETSWRYPRVTCDVNVIGTLNVLEAGMSLPSPTRILNVSTAQVYAPSQLALSEESPLQPDNPYAASKAMAELLSVQYRKYESGGITTARAFNHVGAGQSPDFVLASIAKQFVEIEAGLRRPTLVLGNIHVKRDFTDVRDIVRAYALLLEQGKTNEIYNVCSGSTRSIQKIIEDFETICGFKVEIETNPAKRRAGETAIVCGDSRKIRGAIGWRPEIPWTSTLHEILDYWRVTVRASMVTTSKRSPAFAADPTHQ